MYVYIYVYDFDYSPELAIYTDIAEVVVSHFRMRIRCIYLDKVFGDAQYTLFLRKLIDISSSKYACTLDFL
jgi:hypothetical protein